MMVHGGGSGVVDVVPWDSSIWWLYINTIIFGHGHYRCMVMLTVHVFVCGSQCWQLCTCASLPLAGFCTNTLSPFVSPYVNVEVSGGDGALVKKTLAFSGGCASG